MGSYKTIKSFGKVEKTYVDSLFIGYAVSAKSEKEAKEFVAKVKEAHADAAHNVSAYRVREGNTLIIHYDDDGEPRGSAGRPVLKVLEYKGLENVVVVVTRYFGGTKLGYGGLIKAYTETTSEVVESAGIVEVIKKEPVEVTFPYNLYNTVERTIEKFNGELIQREFRSDIKFVVDLFPEKVEDFAKYLTEITKGRAKIRRFLDYEKGLKKSIFKNV
ncbi:YigZ family protein [Thermococcus argininiproducens]|uniref:YigZ family protein n=1 Tax=Thermococcus argininiproducens TaxID=2866384 RepID=A0A9E7MAC5_9EURY|nr:YigZ family protein [Thermococcus argininiproducens]USG99958.1 YigZ family protein [Thermococcus argininiproducens]